MGKISFTKMHGAGNDFIMINDMNEAFQASAAVIASLCTLHTGIGSDGLILIRPASGFDFRMHYYNRDGGEAEMCGNGARCAAAFANREGLAGNRMTFQTGAGPLSAEMIGSDVRIDINDVTGMKLGIIAGRETLEVGFAICGVPHAVHIVDDVDSWDDKRFSETGSSVRMDPVFSPDGTNFNIVSVLSKNRLKYRTFERGVEAETLACGTGAVAIGAICSALGLIESSVECITSSGISLEVRLRPEHDGASVCTLRGPAVVSFSGTFDPTGYGA